MPKPIFLDKFQDIRWLTETHLKGLEYPKFQSALLWGNEDCPEKIEIFFDKSPKANETPTATFIRGEDKNYKRVKN